MVHIDDDVVLLLKTDERFSISEYYEGVIVSLWLKPHQGPTAHKSEAVAYLPNFKSGMNSCEPIRDSGG